MFLLKATSLAETRAHAETPGNEGLKTRENQMFAVPSGSVNMCRSNERTLATKNECFHTLLAFREFCTLFISKFVFTGFHLI